MREIVHAMSSARLSQEEFTRLLRVALTANTFLLIGGICWVAFYTNQELSGPGNRGALEDGLYIMGLVGFTLSGVINVMIDMIWTRTVPIGRYSTHFRWNMLITTLFLLGVLGDFIAYMFWRVGPEGVDEERITQWVSAHLWLIASVVVLGINFRRFSKIEDRVDAAGNLFFFLEALLNALARYTTDINPGGSPDFRETRLEISASVFWTLNALAYLISDVIRIRQVEEAKRKKLAIDPASPGEPEPDEDDTSLTAV